MESSCACDQCKTCAQQPAIHSHRLAGDVGGNKHQVTESISLGHIVISIMYFVSGSSSFCDSYSRSFQTCPYDMSWRRAKLSDIHPFKCGALPALFERDPAREEYVHADKHRRRAQYSSSLREHMQKMKLLSQQDFIGKLDIWDFYKKMIWPI